MNLNFQAENPKMSGPRLCSLRIPNGSNNILLDNFEPTLSPIIYTKRSRFVDEELSDTKEVVLTPGNNPSETKISMVMSPDILTSDLNDNKTDSEKYREAHSKELIGNVSNGTMGDNSAILNNQPSDTDISEKISDSSKINTTTQSSSVSNSNLPVNQLDIKDCTILRHQQLSRVAEWVQNSSIQNNINDDSNDESITDFNIRTAATKKFIENNILNSNNSRIDAQQTLLNNSLISSTIHCNNLSINSNSSNLVNNNLTTITTSKLYNPSSHILYDENKIGNDFAQNNHNLGHDNDYIHIGDTSPISSSSSPLPYPNAKETTTNDIAQMEYNVRQFLLKQNEWSIHKRISSSKESTTTSSSSICGIGTNDAAATVVAANISNNPITLSTGSSIINHKLIPSSYNTQLHQIIPRSSEGHPILNTTSIKTTSTGTTLVNPASTNMRYRTETNL